MDRAHRRSIAPAPRLRRADHVAARCCTSLGEPAALVERTAASIEGCLSERTRHRHHRQRSPARSMWPALSSTIRCQFESGRSWSARTAPTGTLEGPSQKVELGGAEFGRASQTNTSPSANGGSYRRGSVSGAEAAHARRVDQHQAVGQQTRRARRSRPVRPACGCPGCRSRSPTGRAPSTGTPTSTRRVALACSTTARVGSPWRTTVIADVARSSSTGHTAGRATR